MRGRDCFDSDDVCFDFLVIIFFQVFNRTGWIENLNSALKLKGNEIILCKVKKILKNIF